MHSPVKRCRKIVLLKNSTSGMALPALTFHTAFNTCIMRANVAGENPFGIWSVIAGDNGPLNLIHFIMMPNIHQDDFFVNNIDAHGGCQVGRASSLIPDFPVHLSACLCERFFGYLRVPEIIRIDMAPATLMLIFDHDLCGLSLKSRYIPESRFQGFIAFSSRAHNDPTVHH